MATVDDGGLDAPPPVGPPPPVVPLGAPHGSPAGSPQDAAAPLPPMEGPTFEPVETYNYPRFSTLSSGNTKTFYWRIVLKICARSIRPGDRMLVVTGDHLILLTLNALVTRICRIDDVERIATQSKGSEIRLLVTFKPFPAGTMEPSWQLKIIRDRRGDTRDFGEVVNFLRRRKKLPVVPTKELGPKDSVAAYGPFKKGPGYTIARDKTQDYNRYLKPELSLLAIELAEAAAHRAAVNAAAEASRPPPIEVPPTPPVEAAREPGPLPPPLPEFNTGDEVEYGGYHGLVIGTFTDGVHVSFPMALGILAIPPEQLQRSTTGLQWSDVCLHVNVNAKFPTDPLGIEYDKNLIARHVHPQGLGAACGAEPGRKLINIDGTPVATTEDAMRVLSEGLRSPNYFLIFSEVMPIPSHRDPPREHPPYDAVHAPEHTEHSAPGREVELEGALSLTRQTLKGVHGRLKDTIAERDAAIRLSHQLRQSLEKKDRQLRQAEMSTRRTVPRSNTIHKPVFPKQSPPQHGSPSDATPSPASGSSGSSVGREVLANPIAIEMAPVYATHTPAPVAVPQSPVRAVQPLAFTAPPSPVDHRRLVEPPPALRSPPFTRRSRPSQKGPLPYPTPTGQLKDAPILQPINPSPSPFVASRQQPAAMSPDQYRSRI